MFVMVMVWFGLFEMPRGRLNLYRTSPPAMSANN